jgi:hydroxysqualene synthase
LGRNDVKHIEFGGVNEYIPSHCSTDHSISEQMVSSATGSTHQSASFGHPHSVDESFEFCERLARSHYENFPVASLFVPKEKRRYVWSIYAFARVADDLADEGDTPPQRRLEQLARWGEYLDECYESKPSHPIFIALGRTVQRFNIPKELLANLLTAFRMDVTQKRFGTFNDLLYYCSHSANPIGQLVLHIFGNATERNVALSDNICTALQLANFWQDVVVDLQKGRLYIPLEDCKRFGYTEHEVECRVVDDRFRKLMEFEVSRTRDLFVAGKPLLKEAVPALHRELSLTWHGGMRILEKIESLDYDVLHSRPALSFMDKLTILSTSLLRMT